MRIEWEQKKEGKKEQSAQALRKMELEHERVEKEKERAYNAEQKEKECKFAEEQAKKDREAAETKDKRDFIKVCIDSQKPFNEVKRYWDMLNESQVVSLSQFHFSHFHFVFHIKSIPILSQNIQHKTQSSN